MKQEEALQRIDEIHRIVERTTMFTLLPGVQAIIGGLLALGGCAVSYVLLGSFDFKDIVKLDERPQFYVCLLWVSVIVISVAQNLILTSRAARQQGIPIARSGRFTSLTISPSILVAIVFTLKMIANHDLEYIAPLWMMCYGVGVYTAGLFSVTLPRVLGLAFILAGAVGLLLAFDYGVLMIAASFGLFHIIFGSVVISRSNARAGASAVLENR